MEAQENLDRLDQPAHPAVMALPVPLAQLATLVCLAMMRSTFSLLNCISNTVSIFFNCTIET
jgi:hypothetical protein